MKKSVLMKGIALNRILVLLLLVNFVGCSLFRPAIRVKAPQQPGNISAVRFERTPDRIVQETEQEDRLVTARFVNCNFRDGMRQLTELTGRPISWDKSLDNAVIDGTFVDQPLNQVLDFLSRRLNVTVSVNDNMYFLGTVTEGDFVSAVVRVPPVSREELQAALSTTGSGKAVIIGSFIWITDTLEHVRKLVADLDMIREKSERSYLAEVFFIRVNEEDFLRLTADLRFNQVDIFSSAFNISQLFSMFVDADGKLGSTVIDTRPVLLLSEGRQATFEVGNEITRERKALSETGIISTMGYDKFQDGIILSLMLSRVSDERYSLDMELEVSTFDKTDTATIPAKQSSILKSPGMLIKDGGVVYAGSLKRRDASKAFGVFSLDGGRGSDLLTIWVRCREVR
jgi:type II secretory pathway component GspD/PulD (secretin)